MERHGMCRMRQLQLYLPGQKTACTVYQDYEEKYTGRQAQEIRQKPKEICLEQKLYPDKG